MYLQKGIPIKGYAAVILLLYSKTCLRRALKKKTELVSRPNIA